MIMNEFTKIMENHSNDKLVEVLKSRNTYQENAKIAAITESIKRNLIIDENDLNEKFPINIETNNLNEKLVEEGSLEFKKKIKNIILVLVFNFIWIFIVVQINSNVNHKELSIFDFWYPITFASIIFICYRNYSKLFANIVIWITALTLLTTFLSVIYTLYFYL
jgi:hypothetical protein